MIKPRDEITKLSAYQPPEVDRTDNLRLDYNENIRGCSPKVLEELKTIDRDFISTYPQYEEFRSKLEEYFQVDKSQIKISAGTDQGIQLLMDCYIEQNDEIILPSPTFSMFKFYAKKLGANLTEIQLNDDLSFPTDQFIENIRDTTKMVVLVNPNNPTGTVIPPNEIKRIISQADNAIILLDEAYIEFLGTSFVKKIDEYDNLVITRTFSKLFGLAGLRIGVVLSNENIINVLKKASSPFPVSSLSTKLGIAALDDIDYINEYISDVRNAREFTQRALKERRFVVYPSGANFLCVNLGKMYKWIIRGLKQEHILVRDRSNYPLLAETIRLTIGPKNIMKQFIGTLDEVLAKTLLIFDMDGVLVDVSQSYRKAIKFTAEYYLDTSISYEVIEDLKKEGGYNNDWELTAEIIHRESNGEEDVSFNKIIEKFQQFYLGQDKEGLISQENWLFDIQLLKEYHDQYPMTIVTGRPKKEAEFVLEENGLTKYFDTVITMDDVPKDKQKPHPMGLQLVLEKLNTDTSYFFGDTVDDINAAKAAGINPIGVIPPQIKNKEEYGDFLKNNGAKRVITTINDLEEIL